MKKNLKNKIIAVMLLLINGVFNIINAQGNPPPPGGGTGSGTPGAAPASPIDMYQIILFALALILVAYFYKRTIKLGKV